MKRTGGDFICLVCSTVIMIVEVLVEFDYNVPASIVTLSSYVELPAPSFQWNNAMEGTVFCQKVSCNEIVHWQCRDVPTVISGGRHQPPLR